MGAVHGIRTFVPIMLGQGEEGHVVNTASNAGLLPGNRIYGVTKHAVVALSEALYTNLRNADAKVSCSVLCPGVVKTRMPFAYRNRPDDLHDEIDVSERDVEQAAQDRIVSLMQATGMEPEEVAGMVLQAIRDDQFWIITHADVDEGVMARAEGIVARRNPPSRPRAFGTNA
jgi:short-subunit dehydrogenase